MIRQWIRAWFSEFRKEWITAELRALCGPLGISPVKDPRATFALVRQRIATLQLDLSDALGKNAKLRAQKEDRTELLDVVTKKLVHVRKVVAQWPADVPYRDEALAAIDALPEEIE